MSRLAGREQLARLLYLYNLADTDDIRLEAIRPGSQSFLVTAGGRVHELVLMDERDFDEATWQHQLLEQLARSRLPVNAPMRTLDNMPAALFRGAPAWLLARPAGEPASAGKPEHLRALGRLLAELHEATRDAGFRGRTPDEWANRLVPATPEERCWRARADQLIDRLQRLQLPEACIHGAPGPAAVLFRGDSITGLLDFVHLRRAPAVLDLALAAVSWCPVAAQHSTERLARLLAGHDEVRPLSEAELAALPMAQELAVCLYWLRERHARARFPGLDAQAEDWAAVYARLQAANASDGK